MGNKSFWGVGWAALVFVGCATNGADSAEVEAPRVDTASPDTASPDAAPEKPAPVTDAPGAIPLRERTYVISFVSPGNVEQLPEGGARAPGFDLDRSSAATCGKYDYAGLTAGATGVDNQLPTLIQNSVALVDARAAIEYSAPNGTSLLLVEVTDVDDWTNDDQVLVRVYRASIPPGVTMQIADAAPFTILPNQTFVGEEVARGEGLGRIQNGRLHAELGFIPYAVKINDATVSLPFDDVILEGDLREGAIQNGMIGGSIPNRTLATNLAGAVSLEPWFLEFLLLQSGDLGAACDSISAGLVFEAAGAVRLRAFMK